MKAAKSKSETNPKNGEARHLTDTPVLKTPPPRRTSASAKTPRKPAATKATRSREEAASATALSERTLPSADEIRLRAYFIAENRHRGGVFGDEGSDWLEALRQLQEEAEKR